MYPKPRRLAVPFALAAVLFLFLGFAATPAAHAAPGGAPFGLGDWLGVLLRIWAPEGCGLDPVGRCGPAGPPPNSGCTIDPSGHCRETSAFLPEGCGIDPHGRCTPAAAPQKDEGCGLDPHGKCVP